MRANTAETAERRVIRKFYDRFKSEIEAFSKSIRGILDESSSRSYATVMLSRLMFIYFIQSRGFLEAGYLRKRLIESKARGGNRFYSDVIRPLLCGGFDTMKAHISDAAFERAIDFFDQYGWRLDERCMSRDEINAEVLGYVLERHINHRQMGAYYTKEDVTGYIARNTIIPSLFDSARHIFEDAFEGVRPAWQLLQADPDRYIYPSLAFAASGEGRREAEARRAHCEQVRARLAGGEIRSVNDLITHNLDSARFALDVIESCESVPTLAALWLALEKITVLDPTCGSGAFLVAALKLLEPLYAACLDRMQTLLGRSWQTLDERISEGLEVFRQTLRRAGQVGKSNRHYFILKSIISNNLFGVDLMEEAVEVCKMRLCLKLLAQLKPEDLESGNCVAPLAAIGFNIRAGNALVGYAVPETPAAGGEAAACHHTDRVALKEKLDRRLAREYGVAPGERKAYEKWLTSHKPFHWAVEFREVINNGGFDVIIGNPPYVNVSEVRRLYSVRGYQTESCPDVYAWTLERAARLLKPGGRAGMVVPLSLSFSGDFALCRDLLFRRYGENWFSSFARIPAALFSFDVRIRNTIHIGHKTSEAAAQHTTRLHRWFESARPRLFESLQYAPFTPERWQNRIPKFSVRNLALAFEKALAQTGSTLAASLSSTQTPYALHFKKTAYNWLSFCRDLPPCYDSEGASVPQTKFGSVYFEDDATRDVAFLLLNGKLAFAFWCVVGDDFDVTRWMFADFPINLRSLAVRAPARLFGLARELEEVMARNVSFKLNAGRRVGNYNLARCRGVTDESDRIFAERLGFQDAWPDVELMYEQMVKTGFDDGDKR